MTEATEPMATAPKPTVINLAGRQAVAQDRLELALR